MKPLVIHLLAGLEQAGFERAVITLGHDAAAIAECVTGYGFERLQVDFVYLTLGSATDGKHSTWRNLASSVIAARTAFSGPDPLLIVRAEQLYDWRLLRKIADAPFDTDNRFEAYALVDVTPATLSWADGQFCSEGCQRGACHALAKVALADGDRMRAVRISHSLRSYDAVVAGDVYVTRPRLFEILASKFATSLATTLADAVAELAAQGTLGGEWRPTANMPTPPMRGELEKKGTAPLLKLGGTLGQGANGVVVEAEPGTPGPFTRGAGSGSFSRLAVKTFTTGHMNPAGLEDIMWEVHVLRQVSGHDNIVQLCDVVEMADALYLVMERVEGPDLADFIVSQPRGRLEETDTRRLFRHLLSALRHAHARGFLHGDLKPANVRLRERQDGSGLIGSAVLVDWGMARRIDDRKTSLQMGTPLYASPEQLTGYSADQALGRGRLGAAADVWSLGVTLYEMLVGRPPFAGDTHEKLTSNVLGLNYELPDWLSMEARQLIDSILQTLACDRATVEEVCEDAWTVHDEGPMPPMKPADTTRYKGGGTDGAARDVESGRSGSPFDLRERALSDAWRERAKRAAMYLLYASIVAYACFSFSRDEGGGAAGGRPMYQLAEEST